jgi:hypothetical protein
MSTANYSFNLPTVGGSEDTWGTGLNANWTALDTLLFSGTIGANTTGTAAALTTARTINGVSFDGTGNITLATVNDTGDQNVAGVKTFTDAITVTGTAKDAGRFYGGTTDPTNTTRLNYDGALHATSLVGNGAGLTDLAAAQLTGDVAAARITTALNAGGSAPIYACRAWVNFNGTGTVSIRASGNVSSITDNGVGRYTINLTTAMPDANYAIAGSARAQHSGGFPNTVLSHDDNQTQTTTSCLVQLREGSSVTDSAFVYVAIFR